MVVAGIAAKVRKVIKSKKLSDERNFMDLFIDFVFFSQKIDLKSEKCII